MIERFANGPYIVGATGGSGTRVVARILRRGGQYIGTRVNRFEDALGFGGFSDGWINSFLEQSAAWADPSGAMRAPMVEALRVLLEEHLKPLTDADRPWGWKEPRSLYLLPFWRAQFPNLRFVHVVRDGRDMAFSTNQNQLHKHGRALLGSGPAVSAEPMRSMALWSRINLLAADYGETVLGERYLRLRFEDLCAEPAETTRGLFEFLGLDGDGPQAVASEVQPPTSIGRWRGKDPGTVAELHRIGSEALHRFGYARDGRSLASTAAIPVATAVGGSTRRARVSALLRDARRRYHSGRALGRLKLNAAMRRAQVPDTRTSIYIEPSGLCNLACRFCAYTKKELAKVTMPLPLFQRIVNEATDLGFSDIGLTPLTGDVFMDTGLFDKMRFLDQHEGVRSYHFFTNFTIPSPAQVDALFTLTKLNKLTISVYGHDEESFCRITQRPANVYRRLVDNLVHLRERLAAARFEIGLGWRTLPGFVPDAAASSDLHRIVMKIESHDGGSFRVTPTYDTWGGQIGEEDVQDLGLELADGRHVAMHGPCSRIFHKLIVLADGRVNACACRDVNGTLVIGDVTEETLAQILSLGNPRYARIINEQCDNRFRDVCRQCDAYRSVYDEPAMISANSQNSRDKRMLTLDEAMRSLAPPSGSS